MFISSTNLLIFKRNFELSSSSETYDDSKESKKSRRQLCSNLFEHLFSQPTTESPTASEQFLPPPPPPLISLPDITNPVKLPPVIAAAAPPPPPPPRPQEQPAGQFAPIASFEQVYSSINNSIN